MWFTLISTRRNKIVYNPPSLDLGRYFDVFLTSLLHEQNIGLSSRKNVLLCVCVCVCRGKVVKGSKNTGKTQLTREKG